MIGNVGVLLALVVLILLALRGVNVFVASLVSAFIVAITNGLSPATALAENYTSAMMTDFAKRFLLVFLAGAVFGRVMGESRAAASVSIALSRWLGSQRMLLIAVLVGAVLTYGGVSVFVVIFTVYPLALGWMQETRVPKRLFNAAFALGAGTFTMTALPGSPSIHNIIAAKSLGTPLTAGAGVGLIGSLIMFSLGMLYLEWERRRAQANGEFFKPAPTDVLPEASPDPSTMPHWFSSCVPLIVVVACITIPSFIARGKTAGAAAEPEGIVASILTFAAQKPDLYASAIMVLGTVLALILFRKYIVRPLSILSRGAESAILPLMNTGAVVGFGGVVKATPVFTAFAGALVDSGMHPLVSAAIAINVIAGIVGSASGGLGIFMQTLAPKYLEMGVDPGLLHRVVTIGSGGLDSLPHCGAVITSLTIMGLTHREAYKDVAVITVVIPLIALIAVVAIAVLF